MSEATLSSQAVYEAFATYLMREYKQPGSADQFLTASTAVAYLRAIINRSSARFKAVGTDSSKLFFTCLESNASTAAADWLKGLTKNMLREGFERVKAAGAQHDNSPPALIKPGLLVGGVESRVTELSKLKPVGVRLKANLDDFAEFRRREEAVEHEPGSSGGGAGSGAGTRPEVGPVVAAGTGVGTGTGDGPVAAAETEGAGSRDKRQRSEVRGESEDSAAASPRANWGAWLMRRGGGSGKSQAL